ELARARVQLGIAQPADVPVLRLPYDRRCARAGRSCVPVEAMMRDIDRSSLEPARPRNSPAGVEQPVERTEERDFEILDDGRPEPLDRALRPRDQLRIAGDSMPPHEPRDIRMREQFPGGFPDMSA